MSDWIIPICTLTLAVLLAIAYALGYSDGQLHEREENLFERMDRIIERLKLKRRWRGADGRAPKR